MGVSGCDNFGYKPFPTQTIEMPPTDAAYVEKVKAGAFEYLNQNYDDEFTLVKIKYPVFVSPNYGFEFSSKKYNGWKFEVEYESREDDEYTDDYFKLQMNDEAEEFFYNILKECGVEENVVVKKSIGGWGRPEWLPANAAFDEYLRGGAVIMSVYICSNNRIKYEQQLNFVNKLVALDSEYKFSWRKEKRNVHFMVDFLLTELNLDDVRKLELDKLKYPGTYDPDYLGEKRIISSKSYAVYSDSEIEEDEEKVK